MPCLTVYRIDGTEADRELVVLRVYQRAATSKYL